jgi:hypothetical protein
MNNLNALKLKKVQLDFQEKVKIIIQKLEKESSRKEQDCFECDEVAKSSLKMVNRWKKLTSLTIETFSAIENSNMDENHQIKCFGFHLYNVADDTSKLQQQLFLVKEHISILENSIYILETSFE